MYAIPAYLLLMTFMVSSLLGQVPFSFEGAEIEPGTKKHFMVPITDGADSISIPITVFNGKQKGPLIGITAGVHGYEYPPIMAAQKLITSIQPERLSGIVILVQIANLAGFTQRSPYLNPLDGKNLNREFPGNKTGTLTERIAHYLTEHVIDQVDFFMDMHGGDAPEDLMPYIGYYANADMPAISQQGKEMAKRLNFDHIIVFQTDGKSYMNQSRPSLYCSAEAFKRGIPAVDIECGRLGRADPLLIDKIEAGVLNVLAYLKMIPPYSRTELATSPLFIKERHYLSAQHSGIFYPTKASGDYVSKGMKLGHITDYFGEEIEQVYAEEDGIILLIIGTPPINKGETLAVIGKVK